MLLVIAAVLSVVLVAIIMLTDHILDIQQERYKCYDAKRRLGEAKKLKCKGEKARLCKHCPYRKNYLEEQNDR